ncbi:MAG: BatD family protein [Thermodesulfobacteriota bacterium]
MRLLLSLLLLLLFAPPVPAADVSVRAAANSSDVYVGDPFLYQIQVDGSDTPTEPDLSPLVDFQVESRGGQQNNSSSVTIVNGQVNRVSRTGYVFNYQLTAKRAGNLVIPAVALTIDGRVHRTNAIAIVARPPEESDDFKLRVVPDTARAWIGQTVVLRVTWYIGMTVQDFSLSLPYFDDPRFSCAIPAVTVTPGDEDRYLQIPTAAGQIIARKDRTSLDGRHFLTVSFPLTLIPNQAGSFTLPQATVSASVLTPRTRERRRDPMAPLFQDDIFGDFFGRGSSLTRIVVPADQPTIEVSPLPEAGRPARFTGLIGDYSLAAEASPVEAKVGDPITLTVMITGPEYLDNVTLPKLADLPGFAGRFKIPEEMAAGSRQGRSMVFTQTVRALDETVTAIPPVSLDFFNPATGRYESASSEPIPIVVHPTRIVTAQDAVGVGPLVVDRETPTETDGGIFPNHEGADALLPALPQGAAGPLPLSVVLLLSAMPLLYAMALLARHLHRRREAVNDGRKALAVFRERLPAIATPDELGRAVTAYLSTRLRLPAGAVTHADVAPLLRQRFAASAAPKDLAPRLERLLADCDALRFGGGAAATDLDRLKQTTATALEEVDPWL